MKQLTDADIAQMIGDEYQPDDTGTRHSVRTQLRLSTRIPHTPQTPPLHAKLDLHEHTEEQAWAEIMSLAQSGTRTATIITGASGILKIKFQQWARDSVLSPYIVSFSPINNGSFSVKFKKHEDKYFS